MSDSAETNTGGGKQPMPDVIANYRITGKLGEGGMGAVYSATHATLDRAVALKLLPAAFATNNEYVQRFLREARTVATIRHENVVQVFDAGEYNGMYYMAMELVDGCNLLKYAEDKRRVLEADGLDLLLQASKGLAAAHGKGLVHRDIKPENLLIGKDKVLRIVDFGLVMEKARGDNLTVAGAFLGTPMYTSPEQVDGDDADFRSDVYSLGCTFYRVFTGQPPFTASTAVNLLFKHKFESPPDPKSYRPDLSDDIRNLLLHMLAKKREDRPQTAQALVELVEAVKKGKRIMPPGMGTGPLRDQKSGTSNSRISGANPVGSSLNLTPATEEDEDARRVKRVIIKLSIILAAFVLFCAIIYRVLFSGGSGEEQHPEQISGTQTTVTTSVPVGPSVSEKEAERKKKQQTVDDRLKEVDEELKRGNIDAAHKIVTDTMANVMITPDLLAAQGKIDNCAKSIELQKKADEEKIRNTSQSLASALDMLNQAKTLAPDGWYDLPAQIQAVNEAVDRLKRRDQERVNQERAKMVLAANEAQNNNDFEKAAASWRNAAQMTDDLNVRRQYEENYKRCDIRVIFEKGKVYRKINKSKKEIMDVYNQAFSLAVNQFGKEDVLVKEIQKEIDSFNTANPDAPRPDPAAEKTKGLKSIDDLLVAGDFVKAIRIWGQLLRQYPNDPLVNDKGNEIRARELMSNAQASFNRGQYDTAERDAKDAQSTWTKLKPEVDAFLLKIKVARGR